MSHPSALKLDGLAAGDADEATQAHLRTCDACSQYVATLRQEAATFRARNDAPAFVAALALRARPAPVRSLARLVWVAMPTLAAAAGFALWVGRGMGPATTQLHAAASLPAGEENRVHFKGGLSVAVVRDRHGAQERLSGPFEVQADDRIRVEVAVDRDEPITAGLLSSDGHWTPLLVPAELRVGAHLSELAARFDEGPTDALLLVGSPDQVERARETRRFDGVVAWQVRSAPRE